MLSRGLLLALGVIVATGLIVGQVLVVYALTTIWVERSYSRSGITDGGGPAGDSHALYLAMFWSMVLFVVELAAVTVPLWRRRTGERSTPIDL